MGTPSLSKNTLRLAPAEHLDDRQRKVGESKRVRRPLLQEKVVQSFRVGRGPQFLSVGQRDLHDALPALGRAHYPPQEPETALLQEAGDGAVGRDHEVLDELLGAIPFLGHLPAHRAAVELGPHLNSLKFQRPALVTAGLRH